MIACAIPLASTMPTGSRMISARMSAASGQTTESRLDQMARDASSAGRRPARIRPSTTIRAFPAAATKSVE